MTDHSSQLPESGLLGGLAIRSLNEAARNAKLKDVTDTAETLERMLRAGTTDQVRQAYARHLEALEASTNPEVRDLISEVKREMEGLGRDHWPNACISSK